MATPLYRYSVCVKSVCVEEENEVYSVCGGCVRQVCVCKA